MVGGVPVLAEFQQPRLVLVARRGITGCDYDGGNFTAEAPLVLRTLATTPPVAGVLK